MPRTRFESERKPFLRSVGKLLRAVARIAKDDKGNEMVYDWSISEGTVRSRWRRAAAYDGTKVYVNLDTRQCRKSSPQCVDNMQFSAQMVAAAVTQNPKAVHLPLRSVEANTPGGDVIVSPNLVIVICAIVSVAIVFFLVGVLVKVSRKRMRGNTWFPEGFFSTYKGKQGAAPQLNRKRPEGEEMA